LTFPAGIALSDPPHDTANTAIMAQIHINIIFFIDKFSFSKKYSLHFFKAPSDTKGAS
jgi:hypothetical protein